MLSWGHDRGWGDRVPSRAMAQAAPLLADVKVERKPYPRGDKGAKMSIEQVAKLASEGRNDPGMRAWALRKLKRARDAGKNIDDILERAQIILDGVRADFIYVEDPPDTELIVHVKHLLSGLIPGGDCFPAGTRVLTEKLALVKVEDLGTDTRIWGHTGWTRVKAVVSKGVLPIDEVLLNNGSSFRLTRGHHVNVLLCPAHTTEAQSPGAISACDGCSCDASRRQLVQRTVGDLVPGLALPTAEGLPAYVPFERQAPEEAKYGYPTLLRVTAVRRGVVEMACWDVETEDHMVYLPDADVVVRNCDDLTNFVLCALLAALGTSGIRCAAVGHSYNEKKAIEHILAAFHYKNPQTQKAKWYYVDPSAKHTKVGQAPLKPTWELVYGVPGAQKLCDADACLWGPAKLDPPYNPGGGDYVGVAGFENIGGDAGVVEALPFEPMAIEEELEVVELLYEQTKTSAPKEGADWQPWQSATAIEEVATEETNMTSGGEQVETVEEFFWYPVHVGPGTVDELEWVKIHPCREPVLLPKTPAVFDPFAVDGFAVPWQKNRIPGALVFEEGQPGAGGISEQQAYESWKAYIVSVRDRLKDSMESGMQAYASFRQTCLDQGIDFPPSLPDAPGMWTEEEETIFGDAMRFAEDALRLMEEAIAGTRDIGWIEVKGKLDLAIATLTTDATRYVSSKLWDSMTTWREYLPFSVPVGSNEPVVTAEEHVQGVGVGANPALIALGILGAGAVAITLAAVFHGDALLRTVETFLYGAQRWLMMRETNKCIAQGKTPDECAKLLNQIDKGTEGTIQKRTEQLEAEIKKIQAERDKAVATLDRGILIGVLALVGVGGYLLYTRTPSAGPSYSPPPAPPPPPPPSRDAFSEPATRLAPTRISAR